MSFHDLVSATSTGLFYEGGPAEDVTYTPSGGSPVVIRGLVERGETKVVEDGLAGGRRTAQMGVLVVLRSDVPVITDGADSVTIDSEQWRVMGRKAWDAATVTLSIERATAGAVRGRERVGR